jgi:hypothetical protein
VGHGNTTDVGSKTLTREFEKPADPSLSGDFSEVQLDPALQRKTSRKCGAMSEQSADSGRGNEQVPQQLVHLVGYREPTVPLPSIRPRRA